MPRLQRGRWPAVPLSYSGLMGRDLSPGVLSQLGALPRFVQVRSVFETPIRSTDQDWLGTATWLRSL
jgi:hypothetical protein